MIIRPKNIEVTGRAREFLEKKILPGDPSKLEQMRIVSILVYSLGWRYTDFRGNEIDRSNDPQYLVCGIEQSQLTDEIVVEISKNKPLAIRFDLDNKYSESDIYCVDVIEEKIYVINRTRNALKYNG
jgi:hypothetical protein